MKKNIINKIGLFIIVCLLGGSLSSCDDYLDVDEYFDEMTALDSVFKRKELVDKYILGAANLLPNEGNLWTNSYGPFQGASDENFTSWNDDRHAPIKYLLDEITQYGNQFNNWGKYYEGIRKANTVLKRMDEAEDMTTIDRRDFMGRCYYLRAYFYYLLLRQYGPVPIVPETPFMVDDPIKSMAFERNTYDECVEYICENMEKAYEYLENERTSSADYFIATKGAALATVSRVRLYAASPWYNGNKFYADWKTSEGKYFISQEVDNAKWGKAAIAAQRIIDLKQYSIFVSPKESDTPDLPSNVSASAFPHGAGDIDPLRSYTYMFNGELTMMMNPEFIYACQPRKAGDSPLWIAAPKAIGGGNGLNVTQTVVDAYRMKDGFDINESSSEYPYATTDGHLEIGGGGYTFSGYQLMSQTARMYNNREIRFYASVGFCHTLWPGTSYTGDKSEYRNFEAKYYSDGNTVADQNNPEDFNHTGYTCKKYIHPDDNLYAEGAIRSKYFPIFRYAETLLNYAEALNELNGGYTDAATGITVSRDLNKIVEAINQIRYRGGLPGLAANDASLTQSKMRDIIKRERQIEFMSEGHRYHDLRRWGADAIDAYNKPITGMNRKAKGSERKAFYTVTTISNKLTIRTFSHKNYFCPIPKTVLNNNNKLVQNPGW